MFKAAEVERKIREINLLINIHINLSFYGTSGHYFLLSLQRLSCDSLWTKNVSSTPAQNFWKVNMMAAEKMWSKLHCVYSPEIMQTTLLGRLQKKSLQHNDCLYVASLLGQVVRKPPMDKIPSPQNYFQTNCWSVIPMLSKSIGTTLGQFVCTLFCGLGTCFCTMG